jgi:hypothetical protein
MFILFLFIDEMKLINQNMAYEGCGQKIKSDLLTGNAVVLFAYGLSGSGKTFTVFGPDAVDAPEAWFKHAEPHDLWGILPRLSYEIFKEKADGWKISMKYFQNVVDTVRDLMSPTCAEQHYKNGMKKDADGFMDIVWCSQKVITSWDDFRKQFQIANARKAIAPTQFNPMSTRGHCIMVLEVEMPHPETEGLKQRGRVYVCDLAGTEPAGDIYFAQYQRINFDDGSFEYKLTGQHSDIKKTKELQDQGKKINLSLSEMAQFFMKMAEAVIKKKLVPGMSIPGCNSFFLCKYLKDTMLNARTYLFCAIRPEVQYLKYTFATLGFAKNASVVKLAPKKATSNMSPAEKKLMAELDAMKSLVASLQSSGGAGGNDESAKMIAELQAKLMEKQDEMTKEIGSSDAEAEQKEKEILEQQRSDLEKRGIYMANFEEDNELPYFSNLDADAFRSNRFLYILKKESTSFGSKGDIQLQSVSVVKNHCVVRFSETDGVFVTAGKGDTWHNGKLIPTDTEEKIEIFDRLVVGDQLMNFRWPGHEEDKGEPMSGEDAVEEYQEGLINSRSSGGAMKGELDEERRKLMEEREKWEKEKASGNSGESESAEADFIKAMSIVDSTILDLLPKTKEAKTIVDLLTRVTMTFDVVLEKGSGRVPKVKINVDNSVPKYSILIDPQDFLPKLSLLKDEKMKIRAAIDSERDYEVPERHDPLYLFFDNDFHLGTATHWPEYLIYNLETDDEEKNQDIKNAAVPYNNIGLIDIKWYPMGNEEGTVAPKDIESEEDILNNSWSYRLEIKGSTDLPVFCDVAYVEYDFFGETFTTEVVEQRTFSPQFNYSHVHHINNATPEFLKYLQGSVECRLHITQYVEPPKVIKNFLFNINLYIYLLLFIIN